MKPQKATIITFEKKEIMLPEDNRHLKMIERIRLPFSEPASGEFATADFAEGSKVFDRVDFHYREGVGKPERIEYYFVNHDDAQRAFPVLKALVDWRTIELNKQLEIEREKLKQEYINHGKTLKKLQKIEGYWYNRVWSFILKVIAKYFGKHRDA